MSLKKVLLADDNESIRKSVGYYLKAKNFEVEFAKDGEEAVAALASFKPDVIVLDIKMPKMNGIAFIKEMQDNPEYKDIPVIVITAVTNMNADIEVGDKQIRVVQKPFSLEQLLKVIYFVTETK